MLTAGAFAALAVVIPATDSGWPGPLLSWAATGIAACLGLRGIQLAIKDYRLRRKKADADKVSDDFGSAREARWEEIVAAGMHDPNSGPLLGMHKITRMPVFMPRRPFFLREGPPGTGKSVTGVIPEILHRARLGQSLFIPDVKGELAPMLSESLRQMGKTVWCVDPADPASTHINPYQPVIDACRSSDSFRKDASKLAHDLADLHLPEEGSDEKNKYFRNGSRRCLSIIILSQALLYPQRCTPAAVFEILNNPKLFEQRLQLLAAS